MSRWLSDSEALAAKDLARHTPALDPWQVVKGAAEIAHKWGVKLTVHILDGNNKWHKLSGEQVNHFIAAAK